MEKEIEKIKAKFSGDELLKLQKHFVSLYGSDTEMVREKANSFAVGFGKACELIIKALNEIEKSKK